MTQLDVILAAACLALVILWVHAEIIVQRQTAAVREATTNSQQASVALGQAKSALEQAAVAIDASTAERQAAEARAEAAERKLSDRDQRTERLALLTDDERAALVQSRCQYCGSSHPRYSLSALASYDQRACPRVSRFRFGPSGNVTEVEFRPTWDESEVIWPDEIASAGAEAEARTRQGKREERPLKVITG